MYLEEGFFVFLVFFLREIEWITVGYCFLREGFLLALQL